MKANPVGWFEIHVQDMARARAFYEAVFEVRLDRLEGTDAEMWAFPMEQERPGAAGALVHMPGAPVGGGGVIVYFVCDDCAAEAGRAAGAGGRVEKEKTPIGPYGHIALALDTEGNVFGLHSMK